MRDLKKPKKQKVKTNRRKRKRVERDWKLIFHRVFRSVLFVGTASLMVVGGALGGKALFSSQYFCVDNVAVENNHRVGRDEVLALSDVELGSNIFDLDLEMIGQKIEENPWIAEARVERIFPRQVVIHVTEREPRAILNLDYLYYVDGLGEVFKILEPQDGLDYPLLTGLDRSFVLDQPQQAQQFLRGAMTLIDELAQRRTFNLEDVSEIYVDKSRGFALYTYQGGVPIRVGESDYKGKLDRLEAIYGKLEPLLMGLNYIDLNVADRVIVKMDSQVCSGNG